MAAPVVYDGVHASNSGTLFDGMKFWVAQRVPMRQTLLEKIQSNGGQVVPLEKRADMLIADHVRKDVPPNSYSWRFIWTSVENGRLEEPESHLIKSADASRPVGSGIPSKGSRTPFTPQDDEILRGWVLRSGARGEPIKGNAIYKQLEEQYPHHTWQSWRDRWIKTLDRGPPSTPRRDGGESRQRIAEARVTQPDERPARPPVTNGHTSRTPTGRTKFSAEEDLLLTQYVKEAMREGKSVNGNKIYIEFAEEHPSRSWHSWRSRWVQQLSQRVEGDNGEGVDQSVGANGHHEELPRTPVARSSGKPGPSSARNRQNSPSIRRPGTPARRTLVDDAGLEPGRHHAHTIAADIKEEPEADLVEENQTLGSPRNWTVAAEQALTGLQAFVKGLLVRRVLQEDDEEDEAGSDARVQPDLRERSEVLEEGLGSPSRVHRTQEDATYQQTVSESAAEARQDESISGDDIFPNSREQFFRLLGDFAKATGTAIVATPKVGGKTFDLWDLWRAATEQEVPAESRNWEAAAHTLGYENFLTKKVATTLQKKYETMLGGFEESLKAFAAEDSGDEEEDDQALPEVTGKQVAGSWEEERSNRLKRGFHTAMGDAGSPSVLAQQKRLRTSRDVEIPSTPDDARASDLRLRRVQFSSPQTPRQAAPQPRTDGLGYTDVDEEEEADSAPASQAGFDVTPSQQLRSEMSVFSSSPIPFRDSRPPGSAVTYSGGWAREALSEETARDSRTSGRRTLPSTFKQGRRSKDGTDQDATEATNRPQSTAPSKQQRLHSDDQSSDVDMASSVIVNRDDMDRFMAMGYPRDAVLRGLKATTLSLSNAGYVMENIIKGRGIPDDEEGVWTDGDDADLALAEVLHDDQAVVSDEDRAKVKRARAAWRRLEKKHGSQLMEQRREFLVHWNEARAKASAAGMD